MSATRIPRLSRLPRLVVRTRTAENQMVMFSFVSVAILAMMLLLPSPRAAFGAVGADATGGQPVAASEPTLVDTACAGQVWGSESMPCILAIARQSGIDRAVRLADADLRQ